METWERDTTRAEIRREVRAELRLLLVIVTVVSLIVGGLIGRFAFGSEARAKSPELTPPPELGLACVPGVVPADSTPQPTVTREPIQVYVTGAVHEPQVVALPVGSIVADALEAAGGPAADADLEALNLAASLADNTQVLVPHQETPEATHSEVPEANPALAYDPININTAQAEDLEALPNIGPTRAQQIITYREEKGTFEQKQDIQKVPGIGPSTYEKIAPLITVGP